MRRQAASRRERGQRLLLAPLGSGRETSAPRSTSSRTRGRSTGGAPGQAQVSATGHLGVIVGECESRERAGGEHGNPHEAVAQVRPQQGGNDDRNHDQQSAHGGRAGFFLMRLRTLFANVLSDLEVAEAADDQRAHDQRGKQGGKAGECRAEGDVAKDAEGRNIVLQLDEQQPVEQSASVPRTNVTFTTETQSHGEKRELDLLGDSVPPWCRSVVVILNDSSRVAPSTSLAPSRASRRATPLTAPRRRLAPRGLTTHRLPRAPQQTRLAFPRALRRL